MKYRTIVVDPPWKYGKFNSFSSTRNPTRGRLSEAPKALEYPMMSVAQIAALPVSEMAEDAAHVYLWTTQKYLPVSYQILEGWGLKYSATLTGCKRPMGKGLGFAFAPTTEFVLFGHRGGLKPLERWPSTWFAFPRQARHSQKPESFLDKVERVSPSPRLEMFARRNRIGWSAWGDECLSDVEVAT